MLPHTFDQPAENVHDEQVEAISVQAGARGDLSLRLSVQYEWHHPPHWRDGRFSGLPVSLRPAE
jgi:hypothetical protein